MTPRRRQRLQCAHEYHPAPAGAHPGPEPDDEPVHAGVPDRPGRRVMYYNDAAGHLLGRRFEDVRSAGAAVWEQIGPFDRDGAQVPIDQLPLTIALRNGSPAHAGLRIRRSTDGAGHRGERPADRVRRGRARGDGLLLAARGEGTSGGAVRIKVWGARGSVASPGAETIRYGGNTSCVEVTCATVAARARRRHRHARARAGARPRPCQPASTSCSPTCTSTTSRA